jgi:hypothetical protein
MNRTGQSDPLQPGLNQIEAQLMCFAPGVNPTASNHPSLHNVTAGTSTPEIGSQQPSSTVAPIPAIQPPLVTK